MGPTGKIAGFPPPPPRVVQRTTGPTVSLHLRTFDGGHAISDFKVQQLLPRLTAIHDNIVGLSARFVHLAAFDAAPDAATGQRLG